MHIDIPMFGPILPELLVLVGALVLLMWGAIRGDKSVDYGRVMEVKGLLNAAGFTHIGLVTDVRKTGDKKKD